MQRRRAFSLVCRDERFSGLLLPFVKRALPDFGPVFANYASDLKREAERAA